MSDLEKEMGTAVFKYSWQKTSQDRAGRRHQNMTSGLWTGYVLVRAVN